MYSGLSEHCYLSRTLTPAVLLLLLLLLLLSILRSASSHHGFDQGVSQFAIVVFGVLTLFITVTGYKTHRLLMRFVLSEARRKQVRAPAYKRPSSLSCRPLLLGLAEFRLVCVAQC